MKKYLSVFEMIARSSLYKVLVVLFAMAVTELAFFWRYVNNPGEDGLVYLELIVDNSYYLVILQIAYVLVTVFLALTGCNIGSMQVYTLQRLRITEKAYFVLQSIYNMFCYVLLWGTQLGVLLFSANYFSKYNDDPYFSNQTIFLAFHRNNLMHSILPMENWICWIILIFIFVGSGIAAADFSWKQRRGKIGWLLIFMAAGAAICFPKGLSTEGYEFLVLLVIGVWLFVTILQNLFDQGVKLDEG